MVPHLVTALQGPVSELEQRILESAPAIERWFRLEWMEHSPALYCEVNLRNAGYKVSPIQVRLFPQRWNRLSAAVEPLAVQAAQAVLEKFSPDARNLMIVPKNHAQHDREYMESLARLRNVFTMAGLHVRIASVDPDLKKALNVPLQGGDALLLEPASRSRGKLHLKHFESCTILLNTDLRQGMPGILEELESQIMLPPLQAAWSTRRRSNFYVHYEEICKRFGKLLGIDPWLIHPIVESVGDVDLASEQGVERVRAHVDSVLNRIRRKGKEYGITERPFVSIKMDNGADELGVLVVRDASELPPRSTVAPEHWARLIVQEGIHTLERIDRAVAEPAVCTIDRFVVGGYYRTSHQIHSMEALETPDTRYVPMGFAEFSGPDRGNPSNNRFYMYGVMARLAMLASCYEVEATDPEGEAY